MCFGDVTVGTGCRCSWSYPGLSRVSLPSARRRVVELAAAPSPSRCRRLPGGTVAAVYAERAPAQIHRIESERGHETRPRAARPQQKAASAMDARIDPEGWLFVSPALSRCERLRSCAPYRVCPARQRSSRPWVSLNSIRCVLARYEQGLPPLPCLVNQPRADCRASTNFDWSLG